MQMKPFSPTRPHASVADASLPVPSQTGAGRGFTPYQQDLLARIESIKTDLRTAKGDERQRLQVQAKKLAHWLTEDDNREPELKRRKQDPGGGSRSPSFGRWANDDERQLS